MGRKESNKQTEYFFIFFGVNLIAMICSHMDGANKRVCWRGRGILIGKYVLET